MRGQRRREVIKLRPGRILPWILAFGLCVTVILGYVRVYEKTRYVEERSEHLTQLETELGDLTKQRQQEAYAVESRANAMGLYRPSPEDMIVVHVRGSD